MAGGAPVVGSLRTPAPTASTKSLAAKAEELLVAQRRITLENAHYSLSESIRLRIWYLLDCVSKKKVPDTYILVMILMMSIFFS